MAPEKVIELANQVGASKEWVISYSTTADWVFEDKQLQRFAELVRNEVLEKAAESYDQKAIDAPTNAETISAIHVANELRSMKK